ncbi:GFA family protein [Frigidibacter sp. ROC022]|uniref:GFA family protein n=1 Tax=Frigidibacter sp. ROC022 TaxID=2971796 RepID=UPI00215A762B|nr:GFA family protein [Frigidibacter sp. ROC022]MCR8724974.1 GFA family protein [Frigidibacter sp. ROC022]
MSAPAAGPMLGASCLCGGVRFRLPQPDGPVTACHCRQCRKTSGHYSASFDLPEAALIWDSRETLAEYATPGGATRGFCRRCGSSLWFRAADGGFCVEAGAVEGPTGLRLAAHIWTGARGDYYRISDALPQHEGPGDA